MSPVVRTNLTFHRAVISQDLLRSREPSQPAISYEHIENFKGKARSRKPGQPGQPSSCEEALIWITFFAVHISVNSTARSVRLIRLQ